MLNYSPPLRIHTFISTMLEYLVSLYTSVYWTKRVAVAFGIVLFICSGFQIFRVLSTRFTITDELPFDYKPELGFGYLDPLTINSPYELPPDFFPSEFENITIKGNFDADNDYPNQRVRAPLANVYKILERPIDLQTTEVPKTIAENFGFDKRGGIQVSATVQTWEKNNRELEINGQYLLIDYANKELATAPLKGSDPETIQHEITDMQQEALGSYFSRTLRDLEIETDFTNYSFSLHNVAYNEEIEEFVFPESETGGDFLMIRAMRNYPNLFKEFELYSTNAVYPGYTFTNNYLIVPRYIPEQSTSLDTIAQLSLYNWPIDQTISEENTNVQTYNIKTPKKAYDEVQKNNKYLMSLTDKDSNAPVNAEKLSGVNSLSLVKIRLENFEDIVNIGYIQPIYVFIFETTIDGKLAELVYYVPAVLNISE